VQAAVDCLFKHLDLNRIEAMYSIENPQSARVLEKIGMRHEGCPTAVRADRRAAARPEHLRDRAL